MTKEQYKQALEDGRILIVGTRFTKNGWVEFKAYEIVDNKLCPIMIEKSAYWNKNNYNYRCLAWGTDRRLEIILSIGYNLGLTFHEIKQNYRWIQG